MTKASELKNLFRLFSIGVPLSCFIAFVLAVYNIIVQQYIANKLFRLAVSTLQEWLNICISMGLLICLCLIITRVIVRRTCKVIQPPERREKVTRLFSTLIICIGLCIYGMYAAWSRIFPQRNYWLIVIAIDAVVILFTLLIGWVLYKADWQKLLARTGPVFNVLAGSIVVMLACFNLSMYLYETYYIPEGPNIILISIDDLRADHLGCYGYRRNTSPHIDAFARESILFDYAFSHEPWTPSSHGTMLTSLYPRTLSHQGAGMVPPEIATLAEFLKNEGYITFAFSCSPWLHPSRGFGQGFDEYIFPVDMAFSPDDPLREAEHQNKKIITALEKIKHKKFFAFIHYFDVHSKSQMLPYDAPPPFNGLFTTDNATELKNGFGKTSGSEYLANVNKNRIKLPGSDLEHITALYDNGIAYMDSSIGDLFKALQDMNRYDNSMIIITADHGEEFQEHGYMLHDNPYNHEELMHVPLLVKLPQKESSFAGKRISSLIELIDIMPSVMEYVNIKPFNLQGTSFIPLITGKAKGKEYVYGLSSVKSLYVRSQKWKLMSDNELNESRLQLFDLEHDPQEHNNVVRERPDIKNMLVKKLQEQLEASRVLGSQILRGASSEGIGIDKKFGINEEQKEKLKALGYVQ